MSLAKDFKEAKPPAKRMDMDLDGGAARYTAEVAVATAIMNRDLLAAGITPTAVWRMAPCQSQIFPAVAVARLGMLEEARVEQVEGLCRFPQPAMLMSLA